MSKTVMKGIAEESESQEDLICVLRCLLMKKEGRESEMEDLVVGAEEH